jgi:protein-S-isoprenylcysteine O-methyltransferase Ste14
MRGLPARFDLNMIAMSAVLPNKEEVIPDGLCGFCDLAHAVRAVLEEETLKAELEGYADYAAHVRYRLVPLVW